MIRYKTGDLMKFTEDAFGHGCNCFKTMGAGVALAVKKTYPEVYKADLDFPFPPKERLGKYSFALLKKSRIHPFVQTGYNIYSQYSFGAGLQLDYNALEKALTDICTLMSDIEHQEKTLALPRIGAGLAGGDWARIEQIIEKVSSSSGIDITIYSL